MSKFEEMLKGTTAEYSRPRTPEEEEQERRYCEEYFNELNKQK